tara:strand:- start:504 stop:680 length:177 start_codon:yes stop_codon:yes gene_type:complete
MIVNFLTNSPGPLVLTGVLYIGQMIAYLRQGEPGMAIIFGAYALANVGFVLDFLKRFG